MFVLHTGKYELEFSYYSPLLKKKRCVKHKFYGISVGKIFLGMLTSSRFTDKEDR